jgi:hypothetical protein
MADLNADAGLPASTFVETSDLKSRSRRRCSIAPALEHRCGRATSLPFITVRQTEALELGGTDEDPPGQRNPRFYGGYFRDLDGNKLVAFVMG